MYVDSALTFNCFCIRTKTIPQLVNESSLDQISTFKIVVNGILCYNRLPSEKVNNYLFQNILICYNLLQIVNEKVRFTTDDNEKMFLVEELIQIKDLQHNGELKLIQRFLQLKQKKTFTLSLLSFPSLRTTRNQFNRPNFRYDYKNECYDFI